MYYTDGHDRDDVVDYRNNHFLDEYFKLELRAYRWVQVDVATALLLEQKYDDFVKFGYHSYESNGVSFREYHVDHHPCLAAYISNEGKLYGGDKSVRKGDNERPLMIIG